MTEIILSNIATAIIIAFILICTIIFIAGWYDIVVKIFWREFLRPIIVKTFNRIESHYKNRLNKTIRE